MKPKPVPAERFEKTFQIRKFGDSLYAPLTKFCRKLGINADDMVKVVLTEEGILISKKTD